MKDKEKIQEEIRQLAYELYIKSGCIPNRDMDNWLEAERIVMEKYQISLSEESSEKEKTKKRVCRRTSAEKSAKAQTRGRRKKH